MITEPNVISLRDIFIKNSEGGKNLDVPKMLESYRKMHQFPPYYCREKIEACRYFSRSLGPNLPRMVIFLSSPNCYDATVDLEAKTDKHNSIF